MQSCTGANASVGPDLHHHPVEVSQAALRARLTRGVHVWIDVTGGRPTPSAGVLLEWRKDVVAGKDS